MSSIHCITPLNESHAQQTLDNFKETLESYKRSNDYLASDLLKQNSDFVYMNHLKEANRNAAEIEHFLIKNIDHLQEWINEHSKEVTIGEVSE